MKDNSRTVFITCEGIPLNVRAVFDEDRCPWIDSVVVEDSAYDIWPILSLSTVDKLEGKIEDALREERLQQEMEAAEDRALWMDI